MTTAMPPSIGSDNISDVIDYDYVDDDYDYVIDWIPMTPAFQAFSGVALAILILLAIVGNCITVCAFITDSKLRTVYDFYIFNLAITDLLIGCISMPFYAVYTLKEFVWDFGMGFCKVWLTIDFTICLESIMLMLLLSYDRLLLVTLGPSYSVKCTRKRAYVNISISWLLAFLLYGPAIISWDYFTGYSTVEELDCDVEFAQHFEFTTVTAVIEFVIPIVCLALFNTLIYLKIRGRLRGQLKSSSNYNANISTIQSEVSRVQADTIQPEETTYNARKSKIKFDMPSNVSTLGVPKTKAGLKRKQKRDTNLRVKRDSKAARFLIILVIVFLVSWAPYTITTIIVSFCGDCVNLSVYEVMNWFLWGKSAVNPFIYAMNSSRYRYNFKRFMCWCCKRNKIHPEHVEVTCHSAMS